MICSSYRGSPGCLAAVSGSTDSTVWMNCAAATVWLHNRVLPVPCLGVSFTAVHSPRHSLGFRSPTTSARASAPVAGPSPFVTQPRFAPKWCLRSLLDFIFPAIRQRGSNPVTPACLRDVPARLIPSCTICSLRGFVLEPTLPPVWRPGHTWVKVSSFSGEHWASL